MERLNQRLEMAQRALAEVAAQDNVSALVRDAAIQRFEYSFEATWKALQLFLRKNEGIESGSPKGVFRAAFQAGILDDAQARLSLQMVDSRNLTVHTYNEALANDIYNRLPDYLALMQVSVAAMQAASKQDL